MKDAKLEPLDPRVEGLLINLPGSWYGQRIIEGGPGNTWDYVTEKLAQHDRNSLMWLLKRSLDTHFHGRDDVSVKLEAGEYPGGDQNVHVNIKHPLHEMVAIIGWDENDISWLFSQLYVTWDDGSTDYVADVIPQQKFQLDDNSVLWDVNKIALFVYNRLMELEVL